jgi:hypothetical protein
MMMMMTPTVQYGRNESTVDGVVAAQRMMYYGSNWQEQTDEQQQLIS